MDRFISKFTVFVGQSETSINEYVFKIVDESPAKYSVELVRAGEESSDAPIYKSIKKSSLGKISEGLLVAESFKFVSRIAFVMDESRVDVYNRLIREVVEAIEERKHATNNLVMLSEKLSEIGE